MFLKKLGFSESEFDNFLEADAVPHETYKNEKSIKNFITRLKVTTNDDRVLESYS